RNRMAMAASGVIGAYLLVALLMMPPFRILTLEDAQERVLPRNTRWFLEEPNQEDRFNALNWYVKHHLSPAFSPAGGIAAAESPERVLESLALAERRIVDLPLDQLQQRWEALDAAYEELDRLWLERIQPFY